MICLDFHAVIDWFLRYDFITTFLYSHAAFAPFVLWIGIEYSQSKSRSKERSKFYEDIIQSNTRVQNICGTLNQYMNKFPEQFKIVDFWQRFFEMMVRPLFIVSWITLIRHQNVVLVVFTVVVTVLLLLSEIHFKEDWGKSKVFRVIIIGLWNVYYFISLPIFLNP
jgi:hypothetical protein